MVVARLCVQISNSLCRISVFPTMTLRQSGLRQLIRGLGVCFLFVLASRDAEATISDFGFSPERHLHVADDGHSGEGRDAVSSCEGLGAPCEDSGAVEVFRRPEAAENLPGLRKKEDVVELPVASSGTSYELVFMSKDALGENGISVVGESGEVPPHPFPNVVTSPRLAQVFGKRGLAKLDSELHQKGFFLRERKEVALTRYNGRDIPVIEGQCQFGGVYLHVKLTAASPQDGQKEASSVYHFEAANSLSEFSNGLHFSVPAEAVVVQGGKGVDQDSVVLLACVQRGERPIVFADAAKSPEEAAAVYLAEPFAKDVAVLHAEAFLGSQSDKAAVLKATLAYTSEDGTTSAPFTFLGTLPETGVHHSAFVLQSLKRDPRCVLRRENRSGPLTLSCHAWKAFENEVEKLAHLGSAGQTVRRSRWAATGLVGSLAALSTVALLLGFRHEPEHRHFNMHLKGYDVGYSLAYRQRTKREDEVAFTLLDSVDPRNLRQAVRQLREPSDRAVAASVLLRGGGAYGMAAAAVAGLLAGGAFLGEKSFRSVKRARQRGELQRRTTSALMKTAGDGDSDNGSRDHVILYVLSP